MNKLEIVIIVFVVGILVIRMVVYWISEYGRKQADKARKFEFYYEATKGLLDNGGHYDSIEDNISKLRALNYDREKVDVLETEFHRRYGHEYCKRVLKDYEKK